MAEGIETKEQVAYLVDKERIYGQGYLLIPPIAAEKLFNQRQLSTKWPLCG
ncbi:hypothetical protein [Vibrio sp. B1FLJ16]|uniref:hypothetical protein n=1 Tax=Vibrio sp. B1FLJ16 TaxID=2751178 RepID=UPI0015F71173|nr:hypothetical protein [Vibrio sp. B1FLJ16]